MKIINKRGDNGSPCLRPNEVIEIWKIADHIDTLLLDKPLDICAINEKITHLY